METTPISCTASGQSTDGTLPNITNGKCAGSSRTFTITASAEGWTLAVSQQVSAASFTVGSHLLASCDVVRSASPNAEVENYKGATSFSLTS